MQIRITEKLWLLIYGEYHTDPICLEEKWLTQTVNTWCLSEARNLDLVLACCVATRLTPRILDPVSVWL